MKRTFLRVFLSVNLFIFLSVSLTSASFAQNKVSVRFFQSIRGDSFLSYNFFVGPDAVDFTTTIQGFGSGLLDAFCFRNSIDLINIGNDNAYLSLGVGFSVMKYRLDKNPIFNLNNNETPSWQSDPDVTHNYVNTFFGYGKSKIITTSFYVPLDLTLALGKNMLFTAGGYLDVNVTARYKMKYLVDDQKVKEIIRSTEFRKLNPSTAKLGLNATLLHKKLGYGLSFTYSVTPFFKPGLGLDIHEVRISATYSIRNFKDAFKPSGEK